MELLYCELPRSGSCLNFLGDFFLLFSEHAYFQRTNSLTVSSDVARPDKISGADINAICQEVSYSDNNMCTGGDTT